MLDVTMGVMDMEDDKVAGMVLKIPNEDFTDGTSGTTWGSNLQLMQGAPPGG